jgi:hypothetical protein
MLDAYTAISRENSNMRHAIIEALRRRQDPSRGDWWEPLERVMGINPSPAPVPVCRWTDEEIGEIARGLVETYRPYRQANDDKPCV